MSRVVVALIGILVIATVGVYATQAALEDAGDDILVQNETIKPTAGSVTTLDDSNRDGAYYNDNVTVRDENDTIVDRGSDYEWFATNGTVKPLTGGELDGDGNASVTYGYAQTTQAQRGMAGLLGELPGAAGLAAPVFVVVFIIIAIRGAV